MPLEKDDTAVSDNIKELRKTFKRSHEPWSERELLYIKKAFEHTNDLTFLANAFQRSPNSLKAMFEQLLKKESQQSFSE